MNNRSITSFLFLLVILLLGFDGGTLGFDMRKYEDNLKLTLLKYGIQSERKSLTHRKLLVNYIKDIYNEFALENEEEFHYTSDDRKPTLRSIRGYFGHGKYIKFHTEKIVRSKIDKLEFVVLIKGRIKSISEIVNITLNIENNEQKAVTVASKSGNSYLIFDISFIKDRIHSQSINCHINVNNEKVKLSKTNEPVLVAFEGSSHNPLIHARSHRIRRHVFDDVNSDVNDNHNDDDISLMFPERQRRHGNTQYRDSCRRYRWDIDMDIFELDWYIEPRYYDAGFCGGICEVPLSRHRTNSTNYSFIKNLWHVETMYFYGHIPRSCCTPVDYMPLWMLLVDDSGEIAVKSVPNMRVKSCGCR